MSPIVRRTHHCYTNGAFCPSYTTFLVLLYIRIFGTPTKLQSKINTYHNLYPSSGLHTFTAPCESNLLNTWSHGSHCIRTERIKSPGHLNFLTRHRLATLEASARLTKKTCLSKNSTQLDSLPLDILHEIYTWYLGLVNCNIITPVLAQITKKILYSVHPRQINSNTPPLTIRCIMTSSDTHGRTDALALTHSTDRKLDGPHAILKITSNAKRPFETVQRHTLQHLKHFIHTTPMYAQTFFQNSLPPNYVPTSV